MRMEVKSKLILIILMALIPPGNLFSVNLFLGVDFILGNIPVIMIAFLFHPVWALLAGLLSGLSCIPIWHHPWVIPVFAAEALFISVLYHSRIRGGPVLLTLLFWIILGFPLGGFIYSTLLHMDRQVLIMVLLKQGLNSFFSSSVAAAFLFLPVLNNLPESHGKENNRFYNLISSTMVFAVMITLLSILVFESRNSIKENIEQSREKLLHDFSELNNYIETLMKAQNLALTGLSEILMEDDLLHSKQSNERMIELFFLTQGFFDALILYDQDDNILASVPRYNQFETLKEQGRVTDPDENFRHIFLSPRGIPYLSASMSLISDNGETAGTITGYQNISVLSNILINSRENRFHNITLRDHSDNVIASTEPLRAGFSSPPIEEGKVVDLGEGVVHWFPLQYNTAIQQFRESKLILQHEIKWTDWTVYMEYTNEDLLNTLVRLTNRNMMAAAFCFLIINIILLVIARRTTLILSQLIRISAGHMYGLKEPESSWPESSIMEFDRFSRSLREIMEHQRKASSLLQEQNVKLSEMNEVVVKSEENLRTTLNSIADGIVVIDSQKKVTIINPIAREMTGQSYTEITGTDIDSILKLRDEYTGNVYKDPFSKVLQSGVVIEPSIRYRIGINLTTLVTLGAAPIRNSLNDQILGAVIVLRDISEEKRLEDQLRQSQKMEIVGQLAGGIAHDFNNLLGGMQGTVNMMQLDLEEVHGQEENMSRLLMLIKRASDLTMKLLSFSRKGAVFIVPMDMHKVVNETKSLLEHTFPKEIHLRTDLNASRSVILGDHTEIQRLVMNLCLNSRDAMPGGGTITIRTGNASRGTAVETLTGTQMLDHDSLLLQIEDSGSGIDKEILSHIFEPFFTTKDLGQGSGLGLSAVYGTVLSHQGNIGVVTSENDGTSFFLYFPLSKD